MKDPNHFRGRVSDLRIDMETRMSKRGLRPNHAQTCTISQHSALAPGHASDEGPQSFPRPRLRSENRHGNTDEQEGLETKSCTNMHDQSTFGVSARPRVGCRTPIISEAAS